MIVLARASGDIPELQSLLKTRPFTTVFAYLMLRLVYFSARILFRMEVNGSEVLTRAQPPYLICPNHQSYLDPFLICSTYPLSVFRNTGICRGQHVLHQCLHSPVGPTHQCSTN